jgi:leucyl-tRNA synthetase
MISAFGADTVRLFCLFAAPPEKDLDWSDQGVEGSFRFLSRVWRLVSENLDDLKSAPPSKPGEGLSKDLSGLRRKTHATIKKVTEDIRDRFHFNTAIAAVMELVNQMYGVLDSRPQDKQFWPVMRDAVEALVILISPIVPHIAEELWQKLGHDESILKGSWPVWSEEALQKEEALIVVQVNGKVRSRITVPVDATREQVEEAARHDPKVQEFITGKAVKKIVLVPNKLLNIVV